MRRRALSTVTPVGALVATWLALDQATKLIAVQQLRESVTIIPGLLNLTLSFNTGALFGWLADADNSWRRLVLIAVPFLAVIVIGVLLARTPVRQALSRIGLSLILGGAGGNLVDRILFDRVTDFFDVYAGWSPARDILEFFFGVNRWPTFNVADMGLTCGASLLIIDALRRRTPAPDESSAPVPD